MHVFRKIKEKKNTLQREAKKMCTEKTKKRKP